MNNKLDEVQQTDKRRIMIAVFALGIGTGGIGSFLATLVKTGDVWIIGCLIVAALTEGFLLGKVVNLRVQKK